MNPIMILLLVVLAAVALLLLLSYLHALEHVLVKHMEHTQRCFERCLKALSCVLDIIERIESVTVNPGEPHVNPDEEAIQTPAPEADAQRPAGEA